MAKPVPTDALLIYLHLYQQIICRDSSKDTPTDDLWVNIHLSLQKCVGKFLPWCSDPTSSPHLEEILFGGIVDLDLLSCFPKIGQESSEGSGGIELSKMCNNGGERERKKLSKQWGRRQIGRAHV